MSRRQLENANRFYVTTLSTLSNARAAAAFSAVWQAINTLTATGAEITIANVAKVCATLPGGPREQSIRNDKARMKMLVQLAKPEKKPAQESRPFERLPSLPRDVQLQLNALELENRLLKADNNRMRQAFKTYQFTRSDCGVFEVLKPRVSAFSEQERAAVHRFISDLPSEGLLCDRGSGEIVRTNGRTFAVAGFLSALEKILISDEQQRAVG